MVKNNLIEERNKAIVHNIINIINKRELEKLNNFMSNKCVIHIPGKKDIDFNRLKKDLYGSFKIYPDQHYTTKDIIAKNDKVIAVWEFNGTYKGKFKKIPKRSKATGISIDRISKGKVVESWIVLEDWG